MVAYAQARLDAGVGTELEEDATQAEGFRLDANALRALKQVRRGGNRYREESTPEEFLKHHPLERLTRDLNYRLTLDYGPGWVGSVFKYLRDLRPPNVELKHDLLSYLERSRVPAPLGERYRGITFVFAKGYMEDPRKSRVAALIRVLEAAGLKVENFPIESTDSVVMNAKLVEKDLRARLGRGERLVVVGVSKGAPEIMSALARMRDEVDAAARGETESLPGRIEAVVSISGTIGGSFLVDWSLGFPQWLYLENMIRNEAKASGIPMKDVRSGFEQQGAKFLTEYMGHYGAMLPQEPVYFEVSGVLTKKGVARDTFLNQLQRERLDSWIFPKHAANDGFIEYPGTEIPSDWVPRLWQMTFTSSHSLLDGKYEGYPMWEDATRDRVIEAIFQSLADRIESNQKAN